MDNTALLTSMTEPVYMKLLQAVETGKWLDGSPLTEQQRDTSMQAVMYYQAKVLKSDQHMTIGPDGEIDRVQLKMDPEDVIDFIVAGPQVGHA